MKGMQKFMHLKTISSKKLLKITYLISKRITFAGEAHTIPENLIKSCMLKAVEILLSENAYQKRESLLLSDNTVRLRIHDMDMYIQPEVYSS